MGCNSNKTANRTNLELKLIKRQFLPYKLTLPIAPIWNWNNIELSLDKQGEILPIAQIWNWNQDLFRIKVLGEFCQSHQSGIETDVSWAGEVGKYLPIAPIWNWNFELTDIGAGGAILPIAPIWNWNVLNYKLNTYQNELPIAPIWNWNKLRLSLPVSLQSCQSHQSGIETAAATEILKPSRLPIAPIWNWNLCIIAEPSSFINCQSHQSGIETRVLCGQDKGALAANRTNLEFKRSWWNFCDRQSYSANRTNLELKRVKVFHASVQFMLPIAPIWNWNWLHLSF